MGAKRIEKPIETSSLNACVGDFEEWKCEKLVQRQWLARHQVESTAICAVVRGRRSRWSDHPVVESTGFVGEWGDRCTEAMTSERWRKVLLTR